MTDRLDVIAAFADGEPVSAGELSAALAHEDSRAYLIDVLALRGLLDGRTQLPAVSVAQPARSRARWLARCCRPCDRGSCRRVFRQDARRLPLSADTDRPAVVAPAPAGAPAPTHVFRMENGVNWNERTGGN